ncbi:GGDEF domain-containing protein [Aidingimonas lacisalsi]|uniref:GGDEF domain-containing protein n=1 Tax=Aidingimonas lacisalsi TaxID=2604086 RepID=UPI0011D24DAD|nr:GGDEF domain-containing protein [Aidingimonas lacisalsi]
MDDMTKGTLTRLTTLSYASGALIVAGYALWQYLMGNYTRIILPSSLVVVLLVATLLRSLERPYHYLSTCLALAAAYLLIATELHHTDTLPSLWLGFSVILAFLVLPLITAWLTNLMLVPLWLFLLGDLAMPPFTLLAYLTLLLFGTLVPWERWRLRTRLYTTNQYDSHCDALHTSLIHERLTGEVERAHLLERPLSVLVIHLPQYEMAHEQFGIRLSQTLAQQFCHAALHTCRGQDSLGRVDGSLFWLLLPNTGESGALMVKNRLMSAIDATVLPETGPVRADIIVSQPHTGESPTEYRHRLEAQGTQLMGTLH